MAPSPLRPLRNDQFDYWKALHLLNRAGFGGTPAQVRTLVTLGIDKAVDSLVDFDALPVERTTLTPASGWDMTIMRPPTAEERAIAERARRDNDEATLTRIQRDRTAREQADREQLREMRKWWIARCIETGRPLEEKLTLFWHGHFATGYRTIIDSGHMAQQNELFRTFAAGNVRELTRQIIRDPAMLKYLDNDENRRRRPNENLARELMELFVLGEGNGYTEQDIKEGARALTGYTFDDDRFVFRENEHDPGEKILFGKRGAWNGDDFVAMLFDRKVAAEFLSLKLTRYFVNDAPTPSPATKSLVLAMAKVLRDNAYELKPVLRALFKSEAFYAPENTASVIKSPMQLIVQAIRSYRTPIRSMSALASAADLMGQELFQPPSVKGWDGGRSWINTSTLFVRQNLLVYLLTGRRPAETEWDPNEERCDVTHIIAELRDAGASGDETTPEAIARFLCRFSLANRPHPSRVAAIAAFLASTTSAPENDRLLGALTLITAMPEYQLS